MRWLPGIGGLLLLASVAFIVYQVHRAPELPALPKALTGYGAEGKLPIPREEFKPVLDQADGEVAARYNMAYSLQWLGRATTWVGLLLTSALTILAGFFGANRQAPMAGAAAAVQPVTLDAFLQEQQKSKGLVRIVGVLVALATLPALFSQRLEADASQYATSARDLNKVLITTTDKLYDEDTKPISARRALADLKEAIARKW